MLKVRKSKNLSLIPSLRHFISTHRILTFINFEDAALIQEKKVHILIIMFLLRNTAEEKRSTD